jgi:hypothetical protein
MLVELVQDEKDHKNRRNMLLRFRRRDRSAATLARLHHNSQILPQTCIRDTLQFLSIHGRPLCRTFTRGPTSVDHRPHESHLLVLVGSDSGRDLGRLLHGSRSIPVPHHISHVVWTLLAQCRLFWDRGTSWIACSCTSVAWRLLAMS